MEIQLTVKEKREAKAQIFCLFVIIIGLCILAPFVLAIAITCAIMYGIFWCYFWCIFYVGEKAYEYYINR